AGAADRAGRRRLADTLGDLAVGAGLARRDLGQRLPDFPLEGGADDIERYVGCIERRRLATVETRQHALHTRCQDVIVAFDGAGDRLARAQGLAETFALLGHQPITRRETELGDEALAERVGRHADPARHFAQRRRPVSIGGLEQRAGPRHRLAEASLSLPVTWLTALAGAETRGLRRLGRGMEVDVLAQRRTRRARRQAV